jgi:hypothetical protein
MGSKTVDEAGIDTGTEAKRDEEAVDVTKEATDITEETFGETPVDEVEASDEVADEQVGAAGGQGSSDASAGVGQGAAAIVSAGLGLVSLTGSWLGTIAQDRNSVYGQLEAASSSVSTQIQQVYADSWNANALVAGLFALIALIVGVGVLVRPAFGDPDRVQAPWIKSVAWAGISLGFLGLVLAVLKYSDVLLAMPTTG